MIYLPADSSSQLPRCTACGRQTFCNTVRLAADPTWYLCSDICMPAFRAEAEGWLKREQRHSQLLAEAGEDGEDEAEARDEQAEQAFLRLVKQKANKDEHD